MMLRTLSVAVLSTMLASPLLANPLLHNKTHKEQFSQKALTGMVHQSFTDFSGEWEGRCSDGGGELETLTIRNNDVYISIDDQVFSINGLTSEATSNPLFTEGDHFSLRWNADRTALIVSVVGYGQQHNSNEASSLEAVLENGDIRLDDNKLTVKLAAQTFVDGQAMESETRVCTYNRK